MSHDKEREIPHDLLAEKSVLGCLFVTPAALPLVRRVLSSPLMFYNRSYGMIYRAICKVADRHEPVDQVTVGGELKRLDYLEQVGGVMVFSELEEHGALASTVEHYAKIIRKNYAFREVIKAGKRVIELGYSNPEEPDEMFQDVKMATAAACGSAEYGDGALAMAECSSLGWDHLEGVDGDKKPDNYLPLGMYRLEIPRGLVSTIGGRTSNGKTALVINWELNLAQSGFKVLHMSLEDTVLRYFIRIVSNLSQVENTKITKRIVTTEERQRILDACNQMADIPISVYDKKGLTVSFIRQFAAAHQAMKGLDVLVVDYIQLIKGKRGQSTYDKVSEAMQELVVLAEELDVAVIAVSQVGRPQEKGGIPRPPTMHDLKESGEIENASKMVFLIHRPTVYDPDADPTVMGLHMAKVSEGATGHRTLRAYMPHMKVGELAHGDDKNRPGEY